MVRPIKDSATAAAALMQLDKGTEVPTTGEPNTPREKTTTEKLFPDFMTTDGAVVNRPVRSKESSIPAPVSETSEVKPPVQTPPTQPPTAPTYIKPEDLAGKMAKLVVNGVEQDVPANELFKLTQLERHSNAQLMKLAQERAQLEREKSELQTHRVQPPPIQTPEPKKNEKKTPEVEALEARIEAMTAQMQSLQQTMLPAIQEAGIKRVEGMVKDRIGADDFRNYFDQIKTSALTEMAKPENAGNIQAQSYFDSDAYYFNKYQELKLKELMSKNSQPPVPANPTIPVLQTQTGSPVVITNSGRVVGIPNIEPSGGVPSAPSDQANWQGTYSSLLARAKQTNSDADWLAVMRHKLGTE